MLHRKIYHLSSYGPIADISFDTHKKSLVNKICKYLAKYGKAQQTTITVKETTEIQVKVKNKKVKTII